MSKKKVFVDSDVVLSSLISSKGAAYLLLSQTDLELFISNVSITELERGVVKLNLDQQKLKNLIGRRLKTIKLDKSNTEIKMEFKDFVLDEDDAHIVAGAKKSKSKIILSYNVKHYNHLKLKEDLDITVKTPAELLQYLRSLE